MIRALLWKEFRETWWLAMLCLLVWMWLFAERMGIEIDLRFFRFSFQNNVGYETLVSGITEMALTSGLMTGSLMGLLQTLAEDWRGIWPFLLHRPMLRSTLLKSKLALGLTLSLVATFVPLLAYFLWAATAGRQIMPFYWWMSVPSQLAGLSVIPAYFTAFASGIRPARWYGTKFLPLFGIIVLSTWFHSAEMNSATTQILWIVAAAILAILSLWDAVFKRDWA